MKFLTSNKIDEVQGDQMLARQYYLASLQPTPHETLPVEVLDSHDEQKVMRVKLIEELFQILLDDQFLEQLKKIRSGLNQEDSTKLMKAIQ